MGEYDDLLGRGEFATPDWKQRALAAEHQVTELRDQIDRQAAEWRTEAEWWQEWSNRLTEVIPEDDVSRFANPEGAQESIIEDCYQAYRRQLDAALALGGQLKRIAERESLLSDDEDTAELQRVARRLRAALEIEDD